VFEREQGERVAVAVEKQIHHEDNPADDEKHIKTEKEQIENVQKKDGDVAFIA
jgi:hypothetical protein